MSAVTRGDPDDVVAGLSIGDTMVRLVVLERLLAPSVVDAAEADLPPGLVVGGTIADHAALGSRLGEVWRSMALGGVATAVGFHPHDGLAQAVLVPEWPTGGWPDDMRALVDGARRRAGGELVWAVSAVQSGGAIWAQVGGARRSDVSGAVWAARQGGIRVAALELGGFALARALWPPDAHSGLLVGREPGARLAVVVAVRAGVAIMARRLEVGGNGHPLAFHPVPIDELDVVVGKAAVPDEAASRRLAAMVDVTAPVDPPLWASGAGLAPLSPEPPLGFSIALGLALGALDRLPAPVELQKALLRATATRLEPGATAATWTAAPPPPVAGPVDIAAPAEPVGGPQPAEAAEAAEAAESDDLPVVAIDGDAGQPIGWWASPWRAVVVVLVALMAVAVVALSVRSCGASGALLVTNGLSLRRPLGRRSR